MNYRGVPLTDLPQGHYAAGSIDVPWKYVTWSAKGMGKSPDNHYDTMTIDEIKALPVRSIFAPKAVIFFWVIDTHVRLAFDVLDAWGFVYKTVGLYWVKTGKERQIGSRKIIEQPTFPIGTGHWTRANPEHAYECELACRYCDGSGWFYSDKDLGPCVCAEDAAEEQEVERLFLATGKRGGPPRKGKDVPRLMFSERREHSRKPDEALVRIERLVDGPYIELFARSDREGWDSWGDQAGMFNPPAPVDPAMAQAYLVSLGVSL